MGNPPGLFRDIFHQLRSFHQFLLREKVTTQDPTVHLELPKLEQKLPRVLSMDEVGQTD